MGFWMGRDTRKAAVGAGTPGHEPDGMEERSGVQDSGKRRIIEMEPMDEQVWYFNTSLRTETPLS